MFAAYVEFRPTRAVLHPFVARTVPAGAAPEVEWREIPAGLLPMPDLSAGVASHALNEGEPLTPSDLVPRSAAPDGWWALAVEMPAMVAPGTDVQLVVTTGRGATVPGVVLSADPSESSFGGTPTALVAVPGERAQEVVAAAADRSLAVLIAP